MVIKTILDTDLYKFTTSYAYIKLFPYAIGTFTFKDRDETEYTEGFLEALKNEIHNLDGKTDIGRAGIHDNPLPLSAQCVLGVAFFLPV